MAEIINRRTANSKSYDIGGSVKTVIGFNSLHFGVGSQPVDFTPTPSTTPLDGWKVESAAYHYSVGRKSGVDGWFGFGGRQGQNNVFFRLQRMGYVHFPTRSFSDLSGSPSYQRSNLNSNVEYFDTGEEQLPIGLSAKWANIFTGVDIDLSANGDRLKLDVVLSASTRALIPAPSTPINQTYFGMVFKIDLSDIPKIVKNGIVAPDDFDDSDFPIELRDSLDNLLAFMPIDYAYAGGKDNEQNVKLTKRIWIDTENQFGGGTYMFVGAKAAQLNSLPAGNIRFDPTFGPVQVGANDRDGQETNDSSWQASGQDSDGSRVGLASGVPYDMGMAWTNVTIPNGATISSATIEIFMKWTNGAVNIVTRMQGFNVDNVAVFGSSNRPSQIAQTTALVDRTYTSGGDWLDESWLTLDDATAIIQEIVDRAGWASGNALGVVLKENGGSTGARWQFQDYGRNTTQAAKITIVYTTGGTSIGVPTTNLSLTTSTPTVAVTKNISLSVPTANLLLDSTAPTVTVGNSIDVSVPSVDLLLSATAPTVAVTKNISLSTPSSDLLLSATAPTVAVTKNISISVPTVDLLLSTTAPTVSLSNAIGIVTPPADLLLSSSAPTVAVSKHISISVPTVDLLLSSSAPTVAAGNSIGINVPAADLLISSSAPTVAVTKNISISVPTADLLLSSSAPSISVGNNIDVGIPAADLMLSSSAPSVSVSKNISISVPAVDLLLSTTAPSSTLSNKAQLVPASVDLILSTTAPTVAVTKNISLSVPSADLSLVATSPSLSIDKFITIDKADLSLTSTAPIVSASNNKQMSVPSADLVLVSSAPTVEVTKNISLSVPSADLSLVATAPIVQTTSQVPPSGYITYVDSGPDTSIADTGQSISIGVS